MATIDRITRHCVDRKVISFIYFPLPQYTQPSLPIYPHHSGTNRLQIFPLLELIPPTFSTIKNYIVFSFLRSDMNTLNLNCFSFRRCCLTSVFLTFSVFVADIWHLQFLLYFSKIIAMFKFFMTNIFSQEYLTIYLYTTFSVTLFRQLLRSANKQTDLDLCNAHH